MYLKCLYFVWQNIGKWLTYVDGNENWQKVFSHRADCGQKMVKKQVTIPFRQYQIYDLATLTMTFD